jgi:MFS superfamily sulfate permease-like transporter
VGRSRGWTVARPPAGRPARRAKPRPDFVAALAALLGVLVFDTLPGLVIGIAVSMTLLLYRARACPVDHVVGSRSQMRIEATSMVPRKT